MNPIDIVLATGMSYEDAQNSWAAKPENKEKAEQIGKFFEAFIGTIRRL